MENLSREQLISYIKRQKVKIKQLEDSSSSQQVETNDNNNNKSLIKTDIVTRFWSNIKNSDENDFNRRLALAAVTRIDSILQRRLLSVKVAFLEWKSTSLARSLSKSQVALSQSNDELHKAEQRITKLKGLLARTHQSKQVSY